MQKENELLEKAGRERKREASTETGRHWKTQRRRDRLTQRERQWQKVGLMGRDRERGSPSDGQRERDRLTEGESEGWACSELMTALIRR